ncbi:uncharacterized protein LOC118152744 [Callithrix jacchus]
MPANKNWRIVKQVGDNCLQCILLDCVDIKASDASLKADLGQAVGSTLPQRNPSLPTNCSLMLSASGSLLRMLARIRAIRGGPSVSRLCARMSERRHIFWLLKIFCFEQMRKLKPTEIK